MSRVAPDRRVGASPWIVLLALLAAAGCGRSSAPPSTPPRTAAEDAEVTGGGSAARPGEGRSDATRVTLAPEAIRKAGIATEAIHRAAFAVTLSVPARLSPTPETPEEVEARLAYQAADARYRQTSAAIERLRKLSAENVVSAKALQAAEAEFAQARVDKMRAETALRNLGIEVAREESFPRADLWALADIYDPQVPRVKPGARAWIHVESFPGEPFEARVVSLAAFLKTQTRTLTVRIAVEDPRRRLRPQEPATAEIETAERPALSVPSPALLYDGADRILFVRRGGSFERVVVRVGAEQAGRAEILEGISDGDEVVTRGAQLLLGELFKGRIRVGAESGEPDDDDDAGGS